MAFTQVTLSQILAVTIMQCRLKLSKLKIEVSDLTPFDIDRIMGRLDDDAEFEYDKEMIESLTWETLVFGSDIKEITVFSLKTGNDDNRGGGCGRLAFDPEDFVCTVENPKGITLKDLTKAVYQVKGSPHDFWYELFDEIKIVEKKEGNLKISADFGYGS